VKCIDLKDGGKEIALKISRNKKFDVDNAHVEVKILENLKSKDPYDKFGIVRLLDHFTFRKHMVRFLEFFNSYFIRFLYLNYLV
jgi:nitric oxide synthase oxygenase domain/subunit